MMDSVDQEPPIVESWARFESVVWGFLSNPPFVIGLLLVALVGTAALWPGSLARYGPDEKGPVALEIRGENVTRPFSPNSWYPLGSDHFSRDLLSRLIHGARNTLLVAIAAAGVRMALGGTLGWIAVSRPGPLADIVLTLSDISGAFPVLFFAYLVVATIGPRRGMPVFILGIGLTGWTTWTELIHREIRSIRAKPFMLGARAVGATTQVVIRSYLLPYLLPVAIPAAAQEIAAALLVLAELGFIGVFVGAPRVIPLRDLMEGYRPELPVPEWGGMLAGTRFEIFRNWWVPVVPTGAFVVTIAGFYLLAEGLRRALDVRRRRWSPVGSFIRRVAGILAGVQLRDTPLRDVLTTGHLTQRERNRLRRVTYLVLVGVTLWSLLVLTAVAVTGKEFLRQRLTRPEAMRVRQNEETVSLQAARRALDFGAYGLAEERYRAVLTEEPDNRQAQEELEEARRMRVLEAWSRRCWAGHRGVTD